MREFPNNRDGSAATSAARRQAPLEGFTLIEMLLVLVLIAALSSLLVAALAGRQDAHALRVGARDLAGALRYAAEQSRLRGRCHRLVLLDEGLAFRVEAADPVETDAFTPVEGQAGRKRALAGGVRILSVASESGDLRTLPKSLDFQAGGGFCGTVRLENRQGQTASVEIIGGSGVVLVREDEP